MRVLSPFDRASRHLVNSARLEAHRYGAVLVPVAGLGRGEQEVSGIVRGVLAEMCESLASHHGPPDDEAPGGLRTGNTT